jgi:TP901 family phage tail tape measure protein
MTIEIGELKARLTAEATQMKQEVRAVKKDITDMGDEAKKTSVAIKDFGDEGVKATTKIKGMDEDTKSAKKSVAELGEEGKKTSTAVKDLGTAVGQSGDKISKLTAILDNTNAKLDVQRNKLSALKTSYESAFNEERKNKLQEQIVNTEAAILRLTNVSDRTAKEIWALEDSMKQLGESGKKAGSGVDVLDTKLKSVKTEAGEFKSKLSGLNSTLSDIGMNSKQIQKINDEIKKGNPQILEQQLQAVRDQLQALGVDAKEIDKISQQLDKADPKAKEHEASIKRLAIAYTALSVAIAAVITKSVQAAASFEQDAADLSAAMNLPIERTDELKQSIVDLSLNAKQSIPEITATMGVLNVSFGITGDALDDLTKKTLEYARVNKEQAAPSAQTLSRAAQALEVNYADLPDLMDKLTYASQNSGLGINELGNMIINAGPAFKSFGFSLDRTIGLFSQLYKMGANPSEVISPLNIALNNMAKDGAANAEEAFGLLIKQIENAPDILTATAIASDTFGSRAGAKLAGSIRAGRFEISAWEDALKDAGGTLERMSDTQMDTMNTAMDEYHAAIKAVGIEVGEKFIPTIRMATETVSKLLLGFKDMSSANQNAAITFTLVFVAVGTVATAVGGLIIALRLLQAAGIAAGASLFWITGIAIALGAVAAAFVHYKTTVEEATKAQAAFNDVMSKSPLDLTTSDVSKLQSDTDIIKKNLEERKSIEEELIKLNEARDSARSSGNNSEVYKLDRQISDLRSNLKAADAELSNFGINTPDDAPKVLAEMNKQVTAALPALVQLERQSNQETIVHANNVKQLMALTNEYDQLNSSAKLTEEQKTRLEQVLKRLKEEYPGLQIELDKEHRAHIKNKDALDEYITGEKNRVIAAGEASVKTLNIAQTEARERVRIARETLQAIEDIESGKKAGLPNFGFTSPSPGMDAWTKSIVDKGKTDLQKQIDDGNAALNGAAQLIRDLSLDNWSDFTTDQFSTAPEKKKKEKKEKAGKTAEQLQQEQYQAALKLIEYKKSMNQMNEAQELAALQKLEEIYKKNADIRMDLEVKVYKLKEQMQKTTFEAANEWIMQEERRMTLAGKTEEEITQMKLDAWTRVRNRYQKDSDLYKQADTQVYNAKVAQIKAATKAEEEAAKEREKISKETTKKALDAIDKAKKSELAALDVRRKAIQKFYDDQNAIIDDSERMKDRNEIVAEMEKYRYATSEKGQKTFLELQEKLRLHDLEDQKRNLTKERDQKLEALDKEKSNIDSWYDELKEATSDLTGDLTKLYKLADDERLKSFVETNAKIKEEMVKLQAELSANSIASGSGGNAPSVVAQMMANSNAFPSASAAEKKRLEADNERLGASIGATKNASQGKWYKADGTPLYHTGGIAGEMNFRSGDMLMPDEISAVLKRGEPILTPQQIGSLVSAGGGPGATITIEKFMEVNDPRFEDGIDLRSFGRETGGEAAEMLRKQMAGGG